MLTLCALIPVVIWTYLATGRGSFWRIAGRVFPQKDRAIEGPTSKQVVVVIPARDEAEHIGETINSLLTQTHLPRRIILVDDGSTDGTSAAAVRAAQSLAHLDLLTVISGEALPPEWTGKLWALEQGVIAARSESPDFFLFTDADITHSVDSIATLLTVAERESVDLASMMVLLSCQTSAEKALIPAFVFFFFLLYPPASISNQRSSIAGAAGGCVLISPQRLEAAGGLRCIRSAIIDDCALARLVKTSGGRVWLGLSRSTYSTRVYVNFAEVGRMISRTAFYQLRHSVVLLCATLLGLTVTYVAPVAFLFSGRTVLVMSGAASLAVMTTCYWPFLRLYKRPFWQAFTLPAVAVFYASNTLLSAVQYWSGRGGRWKGRLQDAR